MLDRFFSWRAENLPEIADTDLEKILENYVKFEEPEINAMESAYSKTFRKRESMMWRLAEQIAGHDGKFRPSANLKYYSALRFITGSYYKLNRGVGEIILAFKSLYGIKFGNSIDVYTRGEVNFQDLVYLFNKFKKALEAESERIKKLGKQYT